MIIELLERKEGFTANEKQIAEYILKNPFIITSLTAVELGDVTFTSKSSVFRLCKKMNISYDDLKKELEIEFKEKQRLNAILEKEPFQKNTTIRNIIKILPAMYDSSINNTNLRFDHQVLARIVQKLDKAEKIDIYATGITLTCAQTAQFKFNSIGKDCVVNSSINEHYAMSAKERDIVAIMLSFRGNNPSIVRDAKYLKKLGYYVIGIGGLLSDELKKCCNEYIEVYQEHLITSLEMMAPFISMSYIFDLLFVAMLTKNYDQCIADSINIRELEKHRI